MDKRPWEANIRKVVPYVPGEQPAGDRLVKLNTNENPYGPAPGVRKALREMDAGGFRKYPDPAANALTAALAARYGVGQDQVFVGVGSDDVLGMAFLTFFNGEKPVLFPDITYSFYPVWAELFGIPFKTCELDSSLRIRKGDYGQPNGGIIFPNPNAPTGLLMGLDEVEEILGRNQDVVVIVDEAYIDFGGQSAIPLVSRYENLLVVQTFSKSRSMAGMRIGYAIGHRDVIRALNDVKYSYNSYTMNMPSIILGAEAVKDEAYFQETLGRIVATREKTKGWMRELGFDFPDSQANFLLVSHGQAKAEWLFEQLKKEQIYVRYFKTPRLDNRLRITIGTDEEMEILRKALEKLLQFADVYAG